MARQVSVKDFNPNQLVLEEKERLFRGLENFVNVGDSREDFKKFGLGFPKFFPIEICNPRTRDISWTDQSRGLFYDIRDLLRRIWKGDDSFDDRDTLLPLLLGLPPRIRQMTYRETVNPEQPHSLYLGQGFKLMDRSEVTLPDNAMVLFAELTPHWRSGEFRYYPQKDFQRAVYLLFLQSWRAKLCVRCGRYFIADRPPRLYCSTGCNGQAKRKRDLDWWRREGSPRQKKKSKNKAKRKKGGK